METIIVGTDFSLPANNAVNYAVELAKFFNAKLVLVNSYSLPLAGYDSTAPLNMIAALQETSAKRLSDLKKEIIEKNYDFEIECISEIGTPFGVLKDVASRSSADLVVMGMVGEGGFLKRHVLGSATLHVARDLKIPLFIIPQEVKYRRIHQISFACDLDKIEETTLMHTTKYFAAIFDAEVEIVTVDTGKSEEPAKKLETYAFVEKRFQNIKHKNVFIMDKNISRALEYYFKFHKTDLVIVNPKKQSVFQKLFGESVTKNLAFNCEVPLLIVH